MLLQHEIPLDFGRVNVAGVDLVALERPVLSSLDEQRCLHGIVAAIHDVVEAGDSESSQTHPLEAPSHSLRPVPINFYLHYNLNI